MGVTQEEQEKLEWDCRAGMTMLVMYVMMENKTISSFLALPPVRTKRRVASASGTHSGKRGISQSERDPFSALPCTSRVHSVCKSAPTPFGHVECFLIIRTSLPARGSDRYLSLKLYHVTGGEKNPCVRLIAMARSISMMLARLVSLYCSIFCCSL